MKKNRPRRSFFLAVAEHILSSDFCCLVLANPEIYGIKEFGDTDREYEFFVKNFRPKDYLDIQISGLTGGGWWLRADRESRCLALLLCAEMLRRPEKKAKVNPVVIDLESAFKDTSRIPEGWTVLPLNQRLNTGDRFKMSGIRWAITNHKSGDRQDPGLTYIRKTVDKAVLVPTDPFKDTSVIPEGWELVPVGDRLLEGYRYDDVGVGVWELSVAWKFDLHKKVTENDSDMRYIRPIVAKKVEPVTPIDPFKNPNTIPTGWAIVPPIFLASNLKRIKIRGCYW